MMRKTLALVALVMTPSIALAQSGPPPAGLGTVACDRPWVASGAPEAQLGAALGAATEMAGNGAPAAESPRPPRATVNARDHRTLEAALAAVPDGGALYIPAGEWRLAEHTKSGTLRIDPIRFHNGIQIFGDGWGTRLVPRDAATDAILFDLSNQSPGSLQGNVVLRDFQVTASTGAGGGAGIRFHSGGQERRFFRVTVDRVQVVGAAGHGIVLDHLVFGLLRDVTVQDCRGDGLRVLDSNMITLLNTYLKACEDKGLHAERTNCLTAIGTAFEDNQREQRGKGDPYDAQVAIASCHNVVFLGCDVESFARTVSKTGIWIGNSSGVLVQSTNFFQGGAADPQLTSVRVDGSDTGPTGGVVLGSNTHRNVAKHVKVAPECRDVVLLGQFADGGGVEFPRDERARDRRLVDLPDTYSKR